MNNRFRLLSNQQPLPAQYKGGIVAIGNFDGVHRGHQAVIAKACEIAENLGRPAMAYTFEPHPRSFFKPESPVFRLTPPDAKALLFRALQLDACVVKNFDEALAGLTPTQFIGQHLHDNMQAAHIVVGHDFHFGKSREGTPDFLKTHAREFGIEVTLVDAEKAQDNEAVSSSRIRRSLEEGNVALANLHLGYRWFVMGEVQHGDKRGRNLGFPTANIMLGEDCRLKHGVYAARARENGAWYGAAVHFGSRVQFGGGAPLLEVYLLDFSGDLYGADLRVEFADFVRGEEKFDSVEKLVAQMGRDVGVVRAIIAKTVTGAQSELQAKLENL